MGIYSKDGLYIILEQVQAIRVVLSADGKYSHLVPTWEDNA